MKKKLLLGMSAIAVVAAASIGTTMAVLSNQTLVAENTMTVGNVKIAQNEYERVDKTKHYTNYAKTGDLREFTQNQVILPTVSKNNLSSDYTAEPNMPNLYCWGDYVTKTENVGCNGLWNPAKVENVVDKIVMVSNTGTTDAYFRTVFAFEQPEGMTYGEIPQGATMMMNVNLGWYDWENEIGVIEIGDTKYALVVATYNGNKGILKSGETARPSLLQIALSNKLTNEDMAKFGADGYKVYVVTQAVQKSDMLKADEALDAAFGEITVSKNPFVQ